MATEGQLPLATVLGTDDTIRLIYQRSGTPLSKEITLANFASMLAGIDGKLLNGQLSVTVASNNLTAAVKTLAGNNPSATDPVLVRINGVLRVISAALSVTVNAGANTFNAGAAELATKEMDLFAVVRYNVTDGVCLGITRIPGGLLYSDFSTTATNEKYAAWNTVANATASDACAVCGRFAATNSGSASYNWSVPTYTAANLIQQPIGETRWLTWAPVTSCSGSLTYTSITNSVALYKMRGDILNWQLNQTGTLGGTASNLINNTLPFEVLQSALSIALGSGNTATVAARVFCTAGTPDVVTVSKYDGSNYATSGSSVNNVAGAYQF